MNKEKKIIGYSLALFSIAEEENKINEYFQNAKTILEALSDTSCLPLINILNSKNLTTIQKEKIIDETFKNVEKYFSNFLKLIILKNRVKSIINILQIFVKYCCESLGIKEGIIYSVSLLDVAKIREIEKKISLEQGSKISLNNLIDKELISGIKIVIDNNIIENSVISDLEEMKKMLKEVRKWD